jgi:outer membrane biosynthesis protein TonB
MSRTCSRCGIVAAPEARYCRHCGASLKASSTFNDGGHVSPLAQTVPLSSEGLTTSNLGADEPGGSASETGRVARAEMEQLLRRSRLQVEVDGGKSAQSNAPLDSDYAAPPTGELAPPAPLLPVAAAYAQTTARVPRSGKSRGFWALMTGLLALATISGALLAYYFLRRPAPQTASVRKPEESGNQSAAPASVNSSTSVNSTAEESGVRAAEPEPSAEPVTTPQTPEPKPKPTASVEPTRDARPRAEQQARTTDTTAPNAQPTPAPTASPAVAQAAPTPAPSSPGGGNGSNSQTATPANSDAFYFQAVNVVNGRDPRQLKRAELLRALQLFQNVKSGPNLAEARRQAARLGKELDRLNRQSQR